MNLEMDPKQIRARGSKEEEIDEGYDSEYWEDNEYKRKREQKDEGANGGTN